MAEEEKGGSAFKAAQAQADKEAEVIKADRERDQGNQENGGDNQPR